jgi:hypothetical protein
MWTTWGRTYLLNAEREGGRREEKERERERGKEKHNERVIK